MAPDQYNEVILMLGSNRGDRKSNLDKAVDALRGHIGNATVTHDIDNPDFTGCGADYLNRLMTGVSALSLEQLKSVTHQIETQLGRDRSTPGVVAIDIDIVVYGNNIVKPSEYTSPPCRMLLDWQKNERR